MLMSPLDILFASCILDLGGEEAGNLEMPMDADKSLFSLAKGQGKR